MLRKPGDSRSIVWGTVVGTVTRKLSNRGHTYYVIDLLGNSFHKFDKVSNFTPKELASVAFVIMRLRWYCFWNNIR